MQKTKDWFGGLTRGGKIGAIVGLIAASFLTIGVAGAAVSPSKPTPVPVTPPPVQSAPRTEDKTETQTKAVAYKVIKKDDNTKAKGTEATVQNGIDGVQTIVYKVTYTGGKETKREVQSDTVTKAAVDQIVAVGTYVAPAPVAETPAPASCYPLSNGGNCYSAGQYCRASDHGAAGIASNGSRIECVDNNGWRWSYY